VFFIEFHNREYFAKFANSLRNKYFVRAMGKALGENMLILGLRDIPRLELRNFVDALSDLTRKKIVKNYRYNIFDPRHVLSKSIPYELFKKDRWIYDHQKHMTRMKEIAQKFKA